MKSILFTLLFLIATVSVAQETKTVQDSIPQKEEINKLEEVSITQQRKYIKVESDKTTISVKDNPMLSTGTAYEAVKKLPGVIASPTGGLTLNGKGIAIYIDGAPSTLSGTDLENYLSSLPASAIEKAELIYNPGAAYDANASGSIVNIVTSSKRLKGVNASVGINYNFNKYQKPSPQVLLNGKEKNFSWQTMVGYNYMDSSELSKNGQTFTSFNPTENLNQRSFSFNTNRNFYARLGTNIKLSEKSNLLFNYNINAANNRSIFNSKTSGSSIDDYFSNGVTKAKSNNHEISLQYKTKLDTLGKTLDVIAFTNVFNNNPTLESEAFTSNTTSFNNSNNDFKLLNYYLKYDVSIPFENMNFSINTGGKFNRLKVKNGGNYFIDNPIASIVEFDYTETNLAFYAEARKKIKKLNLTAGLRYENFNVDRIGITNNVSKNINFKNNNIFPNISALYEINDNINISSSYSRKIEQPSYRTLDPNASNFDQYNASTGNLLLNPSFYDNYDFKVTAFQYVQIGANYTVSKDHNLFILDAEPNTLVSTQTFQQFDKYKTFSAYFNFPIPLDYFFKSKEEFGRRMNNIDKMNYIFFNINVINSVTEGYDFSFKTKPVWNYAAQAQILLPWDIKSNITYYIVQKGTWQIYQIQKPIQSFDISFTRSFLNNKLKVGLHAFDLFNSNEINALISATNLQTNFYKKEDSRTFRISLNYNFGNLKLVKENTTIETEKANSSGGLLK